MTTRRTVPVRMNRELYYELRKNFPEVKTSELISIMYRTSAIRAENILRKPLKKRVREVTR